MGETEVIKGLMFLKEKLYNGIFQDRLKCIDLAIAALEEVQKYRQIGTVEECRTAVEELPKAEEVIKKLLCGDYSSPCMFCVYGEDNDAECCNIGGGKSWCYKNAQWNGKENEKE